MRALALSLTLAVASPATAAGFSPAVSRYLAERSAEVDQIPAERKVQLDKVAAFVKARRASGLDAKLTFICTHNSRRSHLSQIFAQAAATLHGVDKVTTYSGGTEATAFNPRAVAALQRAGFEVVPVTTGTNPEYRVSSGGVELGRAFSKKFSDPVNPQADFAAVMTCSQADATCPIVRGAAARVSVPYEDPKVADGTPGEAAAYDERARQIAREMLYVFSRVKG